MIIRTPLLIIATLLAFGTTACAEKPQTASARKADGRPWVGANDGHVAPGWKAGDQASWEEQMRNRAQAQNEYSRAAAGGK